MKAAKQLAGKPSALDPVYTTRDDLARHFNPATPFERRLVSAAAVAFERLQCAQDIERRLFERMDPLELLEKKPGRFREVTRYITRCDREWHKALEALRLAIKERQNTLASPNARRGAGRLPATPAFESPKRPAQFVSQVPATIPRE